MAKSPLQRLRTTLTRDQQIVICYRAGNTLEQIATAFQLTSQRIQQILKENNVTRSDNPKTRSKELFAFIGVNVPKDIKAAVVAECRRNRRSISAYLLRLISDDLRTRNPKETE